TSPQTKSTRGPIALTEIANLTLGNSKKDLEVSVPPPWQIVKFEDDGVSIELWIYTEKYDDGQIGQRAGMEFNRDTQKLISKFILIHEYEREADLEFAKSLFKGATFVRVIPPWCGHHASIEEFYVDSHLGVKLTYNRMRGKVSAIGWSVPDSRTPTSI